MARILTALGLVVRAGTGLVGWNVAACSATTPVPMTGPHTEADQPVEVRTPPAEPVRPESIGVQPKPGALWVDGHWHWTGRRWVWQPGMWTLAPEGAYYAPPALVRIPVPVYEGDAGPNRPLRGYGMTLMYLPGHWHLRDGGVSPVTPLDVADGD